MKTSKCLMIVGLWSMVSCAQVAQVEQAVKDQTQPQDKTQDSGQSPTPAPAPAKAPAVATSQNAATVGGTADQQADTQACLAIVDGAKTTSYKAVVSLTVGGRNGFVCDATFVSSSTAITAAQCVDSTDNGGVTYVDEDTGNKTDALKVFRLGASYDEAQNIPYGSLALAVDVAVVVFPDGTAPASVQVAVTKPAVGDALTIVGRGATVFDDPKLTSNGAYEKYAGSNRISDLNVGFITFFSPDLAALNEAAMGADDVGTPLFINGALAGLGEESSAVAPADVDGTLHLSAAGTAAYNKARGRNADMAVSQYVNLQSAAVQKFLQMAIAGGAAIDMADAAPADPSGQANGVTVDSGTVGGASGAAGATSKSKGTGASVDTGMCKAPNGARHP